MIRSRYAVLATAAICLGAIPAHAETIFGLAGNGINQQLVRFDSVTRQITSTTSISGLIDGLGVEQLLSIDVRPATGALYGLDSNSNLYKVNTTTGAVSSVGPTLAPTPTGTPSTRTIDFNPTVDRIRVLGDSPASNNLRVNPDTGAVIVDTTLDFAAGDTNVGARPFVVGGAYTNSFAGATSTVLYDIEAGLDILVRQTPANNGTLQTVGALGIDLLNTGEASFDISGATGNAYLVFSGFFGAGGNTLYSVNLTTGAATSLGGITGLPVGVTVTDIAVAFPAPTAVPEPATMALLGMVGLAIANRRRRAVAAR